MGAQQVPVGALSTRVPRAQRRLRDVHQQLVDAALACDGVDRLAEIASVHVGRAVAIVVPGERIAATSALEVPDQTLRALERYERDRAAGHACEIPAGVELLVHIVAGGDVVGSVSMVRNDEPAAVDAGEVLHLAAVACVTSLALADARASASAGPAAGLIQELRCTDLEGHEITRRAARFGVKLGRGGIATATELRSARPREAMAVIAAEHPEAISELIEGRLYALLPAGEGDGEPDRTVSAAGALANRLRTYGPTASSSFYVEPGELRRAVQEAEIVLDVVSRDDQMAEQLNGGTSLGVYRLLFRALASNPDEVRSFYEDTVAPIVRYDEQYRTELLATLQAYLANDCNMNATARGIYAHRHTVAYRLQRVKELSGLDPMVGEDRERLGLGLKAHRIVAPTLPR